MPRLAISCLTALSLGGFLAAQDANAFAERYAKKLASPFLKKNRWMRDYDQTLSASKTMARFGDQLIFAYFTRSYAP